MNDFRSRLHAALSCLRGRTTAYRVQFRGGELALPPGSLFTECRIDSVQLTMPGPQTLLMRGTACGCHGEPMVELPAGWACPVDLTVQVRYGAVPDQPGR